MVYSNPGKKRETERERRRKRALDRIHVCSGCEHAFQTPFALKKHEKARSCPALITAVPLVPDAPHNPPVEIVDTAGAQGALKGSFCCFSCNIEFKEQQALDHHKGMCFDAFLYASQTSITESASETVAVSGGPIAGSQIVGDESKGLSPVAGGKLDEGSKENVFYHHQRATTCPSSFASLRSAIAALHSRSLLYTRCARG